MILDGADILGVGRRAREPAAHGRPRGRGRPAGRRRAAAARRAHRRSWPRRPSAAPDVVMVARRRPRDARRPVRGARSGPTGPAPRSLGPVARRPAAARRSGELLGTPARRRGRRASVVRRGDWARSPRSSAGASRPSRSARPAGMRVQAAPGPGGRPPSRRPSSPRPRCCPAGSATPTSTRSRLAHDPARPAPRPRPAARARRLRRGATPPATARCSGSPRPAPRSAGCSRRRRGWTARRRPTSRRRGRRLGRRAGARRRARPRRRPAPPRVRGLGHDHARLLAPLGTIEDPEERRRVIADLRDELLVPARHAS